MVDERHGADNLRPERADLCPLCRERPPGYCATGVPRTRFNQFLGTRAIQSAIILMSLGSKYSLQSIGGQMEAAFGALTRPAESAEKGQYRSATIISGFSPARVQRQCRVCCLLCRAESSFHESPQNSPTQQASSSRTAVQVLLRLKVSKIAVRDCSGSACMSVKLSA